MPLIEKRILPLLGAEERKAFEALIDQNGSFPALGVSFRVFQLLTFFLVPFYFVEL
jgi:hypothetical protein